MPGNMELTERAGRDDNICPGLLYLPAPSFPKRCRFFGHPGFYTSSGTAADGWHLDQINNLPDELAGLVMDTLSSQEVTGVMVGCRDRQT